MVADRKKSRKEFSANPPVEAHCLKRVGRDSNPRTPYDVAGFQDRCLQPLSHPPEAYFYDVF